MISRNTITVMRTLAKVVNINFSIREINQQLTKTQ